MILIPQSNSDICELNEAERCYADNQQCNGSVLSQSYQTTAGAEGSAWKHILKATIFDSSRKVCDDHLLSFSCNFASKMRRKQ